MKDPWNHENLIGKKCGRLTVTSIVGLRNSKLFVMCQCECGNIKEYRRSNLHNGGTKSCGCLKKDFMKKIRNNWNNTMILEHD